MVTSELDYFHDEDGNLCKRRYYWGKSTDTKPTNCNNADTFYEMDTQKTFLFDEDEAVWLEQ